MPHFNYKTIPWEDYPPARRALADRVIDRIATDAAGVANVIQHKGSASFYVYDSPQSHTVLKVIVYDGTQIPDLSQIYVNG